MGIENLKDSKEHLSDERELKRKEIFTQLGLHDEPILKGDPEAYTGFDDGSMTEHLQWELDLLKKASELDEERGLELLKLAEKIADYEVEEYSKEFLAQKIDRIEQAISRHSQKLASQYRVGDRYPAESSKEDRWLSAQREKHMRWCQENGLDPTKNSFFGINRGVDLYGIKGEFKGEPLELIYDSDEGITIKIVGQEYSSSIDDQENVKKFQDLYDKFRPYIEYESNDLWEAKFALQQDVKKFKDEQIDLAFQDIKF